MVTINDEMPQPNVTVVAQLHHFLLAVAPEPSVFEADTFVPCSLPHTTGAAYKIQHFSYRIHHFQYRIHHVFTCPLS